MIKIKNTKNIILGSIIISTFIFILSLPHVTALATCQSFDAKNDTITIRCDTNFKQVYEELRDGTKIKYLGNGEYILNTNILTETHTIFSINNAEGIRTLKMTNGHSIIFKGNFYINGVNITSWDPIYNRVVEQNSDKSIPRPYISIELSSGGLINNSDVGYLGYKNKSNTKTAGVSAYRSHDIIISNSKFHHIYFAFYSAESNNITIDNNEYYNNLLYAIDPHTDSHDFKITNNHLHNNYKFGIIFSLRCYNFLVENNTIHDNNEGKTISYGIFFSRMASNSTARYNTIYNESVGIYVSQSSNNYVYNNNIYNTDRGIFVSSGKEAVSTNNSIHDNGIRNTKVNIAIRESTGNIYWNNSNSIIDTILVFFYNLGISISSIKPSMLQLINSILNPNANTTELSNITNENNTNVANESYETNISDIKNSTVMFTYDDDSQTNYDYAFPILHANNQRAVVYIPTIRPDNLKGYMNWSELTKLYNLGWDVSSHSVSHVDLKTLDDNRLNYELKKSRDTLLSHGFTRSAGFIAYPFGGIDYRVMNATKNYYLTGRTTDMIERPINLSDPNALFELKVFEIHNTTSIVDIENVINKTIKNNGDLILVYHIITPDNNNLIGTKSSRQNLKIISDYIASRKDEISVITMSDYYALIQDRIKKGQ